jgi:hypothetical protein
MSKDIYKLSDLKKCIYECKSIKLDLNEKEVNNCVKNCKDVYMKFFGFIPKTNEKPLHSIFYLI